MLEPNFDPFPEITTQGLLLRKIVPADVNEVFELRSNANTMRYIDRPLHQNTEDSLKFIENITDLLNKNEGINWAITRKGDPKLIGMIVLFNYVKEHYRGELGYILNPAYHGKGITSEAIVAVTEYGFSKIKLHKIEAQVNTDNVASIRVLEKNGFKREAHFKDHYFSKETFIDMYFYGLITPYK